jgi:hypothetical protein
MQMLEVVAQQVVEFARMRLYHEVALAQVSRIQHARATEAGVYRQTDIVDTELAADCDPKGS